MFISAATAVIKTIQKLIGFLLSFHAVYFITGLFTTRKFPPAKKQHKYAVLVAARNEEKVIGNLIDSIHMQDYPSELVTVFVVADNCTDETARIAREAHARGLNVWTYSGYTFEALLEMSASRGDIRALLAETDVLVDGPFVLAERSLDCPWRGSKNQRLIDMKASLRDGRAVALSEA